MHPVARLGALAVRGVVPSRQALVIRRPVVVRARPAKVLDVGEHVARDVGKPSAADGDEADLVPVLQRGDSPALVLVAGYADECGFIGDKGERILTGCRLIYARFGEDEGMLALREDATCRVTLGARSVLAVVEGPSEGSVP